MYASYIEYMVMSLELGDDCVLLFGFLDVIVVISRT